MQTYLVGGAVRDALLNLPVHERDYVVVGATAEQLIALGYIPVGKNFPVFLHPKSQEEYALARTERKVGQGYTGFECYAQPDVTLEQDLQRRDLTINAIAQDQQGNFIDPWGGLSDLNKKVLRHVSPAFAEDPLRVLRTARFAARFTHLGFTLAPETQQLMSDLVQQGEMRFLVIERVWQETFKALQTQTPSEYFYQLHQCGALAELLQLTFAPAIHLPLLEQLTTAQLEANQPITEEHSIFRYAAWVADLAYLLNNSERALLHCEQYLRPPKLYTKMAQLLCRSYQFFAQPQLNAQQVMRFYQSCDAWRRPERFLQLAELCRQLFTAPALSSILQQPPFQLLSHTAQRLQHVFQPFALLRHISPQTYLAQGLQGPAIGAAIEQERCQTLEQYWGGTII